MTINEIAKQLNMTKRAIKYYEEQALLNIKKDNNGYRNYTEQDAELLRKISLYRKLGINISDIKKLLINEDKKVLLDILHEKEKELQAHRMEYEGLKAFIETDKAEKISEMISYKSIGDAINDAIPGFYGKFFLHHFLPYLQGRIETQEQKEAYETICSFWDDTEIKIPLLMKFSSWITFHCTPKLSAEDMEEKANAQMRLYLNADEETYEMLKKQVLEGYRIKKTMRFHPIYISQRKFMKELQDKGYNDIFIVNMKKLSPEYKKYHDAMTMINQRIRQDLGLYYDSDYNLLKK